VLSSAGLAEPEHFSSLKVTLEHIAGMTGMELSGLVLRPAAGVLQAPPLQEPLAPLFTALHQAGGELVREGGISAPTQAVLDADFLPMGAALYNAQANASFQYMLAKNGNAATPPPEAPLLPGAGL